MVGMSRVTGTGRTSLLLLILLSLLLQKISVLFPYSPFSFSLPFSYTDRTYLLNWILELLYCVIYYVIVKNEDIPNHD